MKFRRTRLRRQRISDEAARAGGGVALALYRGVMNALSPAVPALLRLRAKRGKEDAARLTERYGLSSRARPTGTLIWIHGASVGESLAALPLVSALLEKPGRHALVTTGTVTSANMMEERLPTRAFHQYVPVDSRASVRRFLAHWRPDVALFIESELWPNLILETHAGGVPMALVNARLSERSFRGWYHAQGLARRILSSFDPCLAQDEGVAKRLTALGASSVQIAGSLKADAPVLPVDEAALSAFCAAVGTRSLFLAASTHPGEEEAVMRAAHALRKNGSNALTVIVPRHPARGPEIEALARANSFVTTRRATAALPSRDTQLYVADTMGELGLFYRAAPFAFLGGSLVPHGGQNPLEAARLGTAIVTGPHTHNFEETFSLLLAAQAGGRVSSAEELSRLVQKLIADPVATAQFGARAKAAADRLRGALSLTIAVAETLITHART
jgi:3-deoxy-D-manno-octulosonic-acid transferase